MSLISDYIAANSTFNTSIASSAGSKGAKSTEAENNPFTTNPFDEDE
jgi:hypothetical protein